VDCILLLADLKSYTHVQHKLNQVCSNKTVLIYRCHVVGQVSKRDPSVLQQHGLPCHIISQGNIKRTHEAF